jgi:hypothetical protein
LLNKKALTPSERKYHIVSATFLVFVDASENLVMVDDVATPLESSRFTSRKRKSLKKHRLT